MFCQMESLLLGGFPCFKLINRLYVDLKEIYELGQKYPSIINAFRRVWFFYHFSYFLSQPFSCHEDRQILFV